MLRSSLFGAALAVTALALPAHGQALAWKLKKGEKFFVEATTKSTQTIDNGTGKPKDVNNTVTTVSGFEVLDQSPEKTVLRQTIEGARVTSDDTTGPGAARAANALKGAQFTVTLGPSGKVTKLDGYPEIMRKLGGGNSLAERVLRNSIPAEAIQEELSTIFGFLPDGAAAAGATWRRAESLPLGPLGTLGGEAVYTYKGKGDGGDEIVLRRTLAYAPPKEGEAAPTLKLNDVKVGEATGRIVFDAANGRLVRQDLNVSLQGTVRMTLPDKKTADVKIQQKTTRTIRLLDRNPFDQIQLK